MLDIRQAIQTKYLGPTNFRGSRVKAQAFAGSIILNWDDAKNSDDNHHKAALLLAKKFGWDKFCDYDHAGSLPDGSLCFVASLKTYFGGRTEALAPPAHDHSV